MKKLILIAIAFISLQAVAQERKRGEKSGKKEMMKDLTADEIATLGSKKMTLALDLSTKQQAQVKEVLLEQATVRKQKVAERSTMNKSDDSKKPTKEERVKHLNAKLDSQIAMKQKMKSILTADQYEKWTKMQARRQSKSKGKKGHKTKNKHE